MLMAVWVWMYSIALHGWMTEWLHRSHVWVSFLEQMVMQLLRHYYHFLVFVLAAQVQPLLCSMMYLLDLDDVLVQINIEIKPAFLTMWFSWLCIKKQKIKFLDSHHRSEDQMKENPSLESHKFRDSSPNHKNSSSCVCIFARIKGDLILSWMMAISNPQDESCNFLPKSFLLKSGE